MTDEQVMVVITWVRDHLCEKRLPDTPDNIRAGAMVLASKLCDVAYTSLISWTGPLPRASCVLEGPQVAFYEDRPPVVHGHPGLAALEHNRHDVLGQVCWPDM